MGIKLNQCVVVITLIFIMLSNISGVEAKSQVARSKEELKTLQANIALLKRNIAKNRSDESDLLVNLKKIEKKITKLERQKKHHTQSYNQAHKEQKLLTAQLDVLQEQQKDIQSSLTELIRLRYLLNDQNIIKLMLNQEDIEALSRSLIYYKYVANEGDRFLNEVVTQANDIKIKSEQSRINKVEIKEVLAQLTITTAQITDKKKIREENLKTLRQDIDKQKNKVSLFQSRENELQSLIDTLNKQRLQLKKEREQKAREQAAREKASLKEKEALALKNSTKTKPTSDLLPNSSNTVSKKPPAPIVINGDFAALKGKLALPVKGALISRFGDKIQESGLLQTGIMLSAESGQSVTAIFQGQVVYADWFRGYGQLLVIDHGQGYMSLYGHNQSLSVGLGEIVNPGQEVAKVGVTGGLISPGLYFEIRDQGEPSDPLKWCVI